MKLYLDDIRNPHQSGYKDDEPKLYYVEGYDL